MERAVMKEKETIDDGRIFDIQGLKTYTFTQESVVKAVDGVDFYVKPGEVLGLVGESGCGKSVTSLSIMRLMSSLGEIVDGQILFEGRNLLDLPESEMVYIRGNRCLGYLDHPFRLLKDRIV
jgi:ABC-type dipeptide/oligopeptide/nickel transport system ATPase component